MACGHDDSDKYRPGLLLLLLLLLLIPTTSAITMSITTMMTITGSGSPGRSPKEERLMITAARFLQVGRPSCHPTISVQAIKQ